METAAITTKHQITIPSKVRKSLNLQKGDRLSFELATDGSCVVRKVALHPSDGAAKPFIRSDQKPLSDQEMREAVEKGALQSYQRRGS